MNSYPPRLITTRLGGELWVDEEGHISFSSMMMIKKKKKEAASNSTLEQAQSCFWPRLITLSLEQSFLAP